MVLVQVDAVTQEMRDRIKTVAFGLIGPSLLLIAGQGVVSCRSAQDRARTMDARMIELTGLTSNVLKATEEHGKSIAILQTDVAILKDRAEHRP